MVENNSLSVIERLEVESDVKKLMNTYCSLADQFRWEEWAECFCEDTVFDIPNAFGNLKGRKEILATCKGNMDHIYAEMQHYIVNVSVDVLSKDKATATGNLIFVGIPDAAKPTQYYQSGGRYQWEFTKGEEGWRISRAVLNFLWNNGQDSDSVFDAAS